MRLASLIFILCSFALLGVGCARSDSRVTKTIRSNGVEVQLRGQDGKDVQMRDEKTGDLTVFGENVEVPRDFPEDVPRYPGAKTTIVLTERAERSSTLHQVTGDDTEKVATWLDAALKVKGFSLLETYGNPETKYLIYGKRGVTLSLTVARDTSAKSTTITFIRTEEK